MVSQKINSPTLIRRAAELFRKSGYHGTSISEIAEHCGLSKASLYHHFSSKKELACQAILQVHYYFKENVFSLAHDQNLPASDRWDRSVTEITNYFINQNGTCLISAFAFDAINDEPEFVALLNAFMKELTSTLASILKFKFEQIEAERIANDLTTLFHGSVILGRIFNDHQQRFKDIETRLHGLIRDKNDSFSKRLPIS